MGKKEKKKEETKKGRSSKDGVETSLRLDRRRENRKRMASEGRDVEGREARIIELLYSPSERDSRA